MRKPGDTDPITAEELYESMWDTANKYPGTEITKHFQSYIAQMDTRSNRMMRGGGLTWWDVDLGLRPLDEITYECDARLLGGPSLADCARIQWQGLGSASDTLHVGPQTAKFIMQSK